MHAADLRDLLKYLEPDERKDFARCWQRLRVPAWVPLAGPQTLAYYTDADVTGFGGAGGGGKTDLALGLAVTSHRRSIIFRREAKQLRAIVDRAQEILGGAGRFNATSGIWRGLPGGRQIEFGGCKDPGDVQAYRGRPHDFLAIDEADQFTQPMFRFLTGWLRTTTPGQRCRVLLTFNPPSTQDGEWLLSFFAPWLDRQHPRPAKPCELRWYAMVDGKEVEREDGRPFTHNGEEIRPKSRTFIPAKLVDNPYLLRTGYAATLQALPEPLRSQLLHGDFTVGREDDAWQTIPTEWVRAAQARWRPDGRPKDGEGNPAPLTACGVDPARGGRAKTVILKRYGAWFAPPLKYAGENTPDAPKVLGLVQKSLLEDGGEPTVHVDVVGIGAAVYDMMKLAGMNVSPVNFGKAVARRDRTRLLTFQNLRSFAYWSLREALDPTSGDNLALPPDPELLSDLCAPRWQPRPAGIILEPKDGIEERLGRTVDVGDACVLASLPPRGPWRMESF
jgi:hypothetical protein